MGRVRDLTAEYLRRRLDYDPETGEFRWRTAPGNDRITNAWNAAHVGKVAGALRPDGYIKIGIHGTAHLAHRLAWLWMTGQWPAIEIDHRRPNSRSDNRWSNIREATSEQNKRNRGADASNTLGIKGVTRDKKSYRAQIGHAGVSWSIGHYKTPEEAHAAYCEVATKLHGEFARTE